MRKLYSNIYYDLVYLLVSLFDCYNNSNKINISISRFWSQYETQAGSCKVKAALLRVVRRHLTPPPTSTNIERLFSYAGLAMDKHRASMNPENLDRIMFIRENLFLLNFKIDWD